MFNKKGAMCLCNQKSKLMTGLKVEVSASTVGKREDFFLDGCAIFWVVLGQVKELLDPSLRIFENT